MQEALMKKFIESPKRQVLADPNFSKAQPNTWNVRNAKVEALAALPRVGIAQTALPSKLVITLIDTYEKWKLARTLGRDPQVG